MFIRGNAHVVPSLEEFHRRKEWELLTTSSILPCCVILPPMTEFTLSRASLQSELSEHMVQLVGSLDRSFPPVSIY